MAIIKCPECGRQISDKAPTCPNCGVEIAGKIIKCPHCGEIYFSSQEMCPNCHEMATAGPGGPTMVAANTTVAAQDNAVAAQNNAVASQNAAGNDASGVPVTPPTPPTRWYSLSSYAACCIISTIMPTVPRSRKLTNTP